MTKYNLVPLDIYILKYINDWCNMIYPDINIKNKKLLIIIHFFHIVVILFNLIGAFLPPKYLIYYIVFTLLLLSSWYIFLNHCPLLYITNHIDNQYYDFFPLTNITRMSIICILLLWSILGYKYPNLSLFRLLLHFINYISIKYDK